MGVVPETDGNGLAVAAARQSGHGGSGFGERGLARGAPPVGVE